jgi:hypothetical protein
LVVNVDHSVEQVQLRDLPFHRIQRINQRVLESQHLHKIVNLMFTIAN